MGAKGAGPRRGADLCVVAAVLLGSCRQAAAQIYHFTDEAVPGARSLHTLYAFYVYSQDDAPERGSGPPYVEFHGLRARSTGSKGNAQMQDYRSVQLSVMRYRDFWKLIDPKKFCSDKEDVTMGYADVADELMVRKPVGESFRDVNVYRHTVRFDDESGAVITRDKQLAVRSTGVYILVFSNCGDISDAAITGSIIVKNTYGFLPGNEFPKMPFYGWLSLLYSVLAVLWLVLSIRWWKEVSPIQNCIGAVILFGLIECFLWYVFFNDWNHGGVRSKTLSTLAIFFTVMKAAFSYMLVLVASLGWGVTRPFLDPQVITKIQALCILYIVLDFIREVALSFRHSHSLSMLFVFLCLLPVSLLHGVIFYWVFTALSNLMESLKERRQFEKLALFQKLWKILIVSLVTAAIALLYQIFSVYRSPTVKWKHQWISVEGASHSIFLLVLMAMMYLLAPHKYSQRYAYSQQVDDKEVDKFDMSAGSPEAVWADEDGLGDDGDEGESFWASTRMPTEDRSGSALRNSAMSADVIGAGGADDERI